MAQNYAFSEKSIVINTEPLFAKEQVFTFPQMLDKYVVSSYFEVTVDSFEYVLGTLLD